MAIEDIVGEGSKKSLLEEKLKQAEVGVIEKMMTDWMKIQNEEESREREDK